jgi:hypothetical protein
LFVCFVCWIVVGNGNLTTISCSSPSVIGKCSLNPPTVFFVCLLNRCWKWQSDDDLVFKSVYDWRKLTNPYTHTLFVCLFVVELLLEMSIWLSRLQVRLWLEKAH